MKVYDPTTDGFDNARLLMVLSRLSSVMSKEVSEIALGGWNPLFMEADAAGRAMQVFGDLRAELDHFDTQARIARRASAPAT